MRQDVEVRHGAQLQVVFAHDLGAHDLVGVDELDVGIDRDRLAARDVDVAGQRGGEGRGAPLRRAVLQLPLGHLPAEARHVLPIGVVAGDRVIVGAFRPVVGAARRRGDMDRRPLRRLLVAGGKEKAKTEDRAVPQGKLL